MPDTVVALLDRAAALGLERRAAVEALALADRPLVVGAVAGQLYELARLRADVPWNGSRWFDVAVLDEASQLPVADAATLLCALREGARLVVAGDVRQLGPVRRLSPVEPIRWGRPAYPAPRPVRPAGGTGRSRRREPPRHRAGPRRQRLRPPAADAPDRARPAGAQLPHERRDRSLAAAALLRRPVPRPRARPPAAPGDPRPGDAPAPPGWPARLPWSPHWAAVLDPDLPVAVLTYPARQHALSNAFEAQVVAALALLLRRHLPRPGAGARDAGGAGGAGPRTRRRRSGASGPSRWRSSPPTAPSGRSSPTCWSAPGPSSGAPPRVETVDAVQGQEREVVLASYGASDPDFVAAEAPFLLDPRRFNVTLTRARTKFVALFEQLAPPPPPGGPRRGGAGGGRAAVRPPLLPAGRGLLAALPRGRPPTDRARAAAGAGDRGGTATPVGAGGRAGRSRS